MHTLTITTKSDPNTRHIEISRNGTPILYTRVKHNQLVNALHRAADGTPTKIQGSFREPLKISRRGDTFRFRLSKIHADITSTELLEALDG